MNVSRHYEELSRYGRTWRWTAIVTSSVVVLIWMCRWLRGAGWAPGVLGFVGNCSSVDSGAWYTPPSDPCAYTIAFAVALGLQPFFPLSAILAWVLARRRMQGTTALVAAPLDDYRVAPPLQPRSWRVSGPFPWWAAAMFFVSMLLQVLLRLPLSMLARIPSEVLAPVCLLYFWWRRCRRDASRAGVIEQATKPDGSPTFGLRTLGGIRPVQIVAIDRVPPKIHLDREGTREVWHAVDPIDDLVRVEATHTAA